MTRTILRKGGSSKTCAGSDTGSLLLRVPKHRPPVALGRPVSGLFSPGLETTWCKKDYWPFHPCQALFQFWMMKNKTPSFSAFSFFIISILIHSFLCKKEHKSGLFFAFLSRRASSFQFGRPGLIESIHNGLFVVLFSAFACLDVNAGNYSLCGLWRECVYVLLLFEYCQLHFKGA